MRNIHTDFNLGTLDESQVAANPFDQFQTWLEAAATAQVPDHNAMTLATANHEGQPSARIVLLRDVNPDGLIFYTNYQSRKGRDLTGNPRAALLFFWSVLQRQVRIEGIVEKIPPDLSDTYFKNRPYESRLGTWASLQSETIAERQILDAHMEELKEQYSNGNVPRPPHWGGYLLVPHLFEFWQGRAHRLHDRLVYTRTDQHTWTLSRLAP
jgi:pyridoxamine 5'-phosphate oxidase